MLRNSHEPQYFFRKSGIALDDVPNGGGWNALLAEFQHVNTLTAAAKQVRANVRQVRAFLQHATPATADDWTTEAVQSFLAHLREQGRSRKTILNVRGSLSRFCRFLKSKRLLRDNPCSDVVCERPAEIPPPTLDDDALGHAAELAATHGIQAEFACSVYAGLRREEICRLAWEHVDFAARSLLVAESKSGRPRVVPMSRPLMDALRAQRRHTGTQTWVFPARQTYRGGWRWTDRHCSVNAMSARLKPLQDALPNFGALGGRRVGNGWHLMRHTFATRLANANVSLYKISTWMGHSDIRVTQRYARLRRNYDPEIERVMTL